MPLIQLKQIEPFSLGGSATASYVDHGLQPGSGGADDTIALEQTVISGSFFVLTSAPYTIPTVKRRIQLASPNNNAGRTFTINGQLDGVPVTEDILGPTGINNPTETTKLYDQVDSVQVNGGNASLVSIGHITGLYELDLSSGDIHYITQNESMTIQATNRPAAGTLHQIRLVIVHTASFRLLSSDLFVGDLSLTTYGPQSFGGALPDPTPANIIDLLVQFYGPDEAIVQVLNGNHEYEPLIG